MVHKVDVLILDRVPPSACRVTWDLNLTLVLGYLFPR